MTMISPQAGATDIAMCWFLASPVLSVKKGGSISLIVCFIWDTVEFGMATFYDVSGFNFSQRLLPTRQQQKY
jgi:hypothetical protein